MTLSGSAIALMSLIIASVGAALLVVFAAFIMWIVGSFISGYVFPGLESFLTWFVILFAALGIGTLLFLGIFGDD